MDKIKVITTLKHNNDLIFSFTTHITEHQLDPYLSTISSWKLLSSSYSLVLETCFQLLSFLFFQHRGERTRLKRNSIHWALCIPSSCTPKDLEVSLKEAIEPINKLYGLNTRINVEDNLCQIRTSKPLSAGEVTFLCV